MTHRSAIPAISVLTHCDKPRTVREIAAKLGKTPASVHDKLSKLRRDGYAKMDGTYDGLPLWVATEAGKAASASATQTQRTYVGGGALDLLKLVAAEPGLNAADAARRLNRNQSSVNTVAKRLAAKGLVELGARTKAGMPIRVTALGLAEIGGGR